MKWIIAKIGTHASQRILILKGSLQVGCPVEWSETGQRRGRRETGIVSKVLTHIVFIDRF